MTSLDDRRKDLTRWNRRGLKRFQYVDGDAASWLEELRLSHLSQFLRGVEGDPRNPDYWLDIFSRPEEEWPEEPDQWDLIKALSWKGIWQDFPDQIETSKKRNERLLGRYHKDKGDQTFEISRAFARAAHVLLGYTNAYANEGYIRTATQWDNLKKLATMVGYFPAPAASATTVVGLTTKAGVRFETLKPGLGMKHSPSEGGPPIIFETLEELVIHEDLNELRALDWNKNPDEQELDPETQDLEQIPVWAADGYKEELSVGDIVLFLDEGDPTNNTPTSLSTVKTNKGSKGNAENFELGFKTYPGTKPKAKNARLLVGYSKPRRGLLQSSPGPNQIVVEVSNPAQFLEGAIVAVREQGLTDVTYASIVKKSGMRLLLEGVGPPHDQDPIEISPLPEFGVATGNNLLPAEISTLIFFNSDGNIESLPWEEEVEDSQDQNKIINNRFKITDANVKKAFGLSSSGADFEVTEIVPKIPSGFEFEGAPPEGLVSGSWLVAAPDEMEILYALKVDEVDESDKTYSVTFSILTDLPETDPSEILFYGPFAETLKLENHAQNDEPAVDLEEGTILEFGNPPVLENDVPEAISLLKTNRKILVENTKTKRAVVAKIAKPPIPIPDEPRQVKLFFEANDELETGFPKFQTVFRANAVKTSHGETKPPKTLGSGNGEKPTQTFHFDEPEIAFVPDPSSETGVRPDIDVEVAGEIWTWVGSILEAETTPKSYTTTIREDGTLDIRFLTRLPTGTDNIVALRYRVGTGPTGNKVPPYSFTKPLKSSAFIKEINQPLNPSGGAGREPVSALRTNAPAHLKALGRAVSCSDFATLGARHSSVLKARSEKQIETGKGVHVTVTILPANGQEASPTLITDVQNFIQSRAVPGISVTVESFDPVPVPFEATLLVDGNAFDPDLVLEAAEKALLANFSTVNRELGQSLFRGDVLIVLENVQGVEAVKGAGFSFHSEYTARGKFPETEPFRTIHAFPGQVLHLEQPGDIILSPGEFR